MSATLVLRNRRHSLIPAGTPGVRPLTFHRRLPGYAATPLVEAPDLAATLGIGRLLIKDESARLNLPSFKILGASWAIYRALEARLGLRLDMWQRFEELVERAAALRPMTLAAATDGNHGRAVARMAALLGFAARIFVPAGTATARITAIREEGASVEVVDGSYDDAVATAAETAGERCIVISDTAWPGYEEIPRWVIEGYSSIFHEIDHELAIRGEAGPDIVVVQIGVGALAAAVVAHFRRDGLRRKTMIIGIEPLEAACALRSIEAGRIVTLPGSQHSIMAGLNCGTPSPVAWPLVSTGVDLFAAIDDAWAHEGMRALARAGVVSGETGAAGMAGLLALLTADDLAGARREIGVTTSSSVLVLSTEGATDPGAYTRVVRNTPGA